MSELSQYGKKQVGGCRQKRSEEKYLHHTAAHGENSADKGAGQRHQNAENLADGRHFFFGKAHVAVKRIGHYPHYDVTDAVSGNQKQYNQSPPAETAEKIRKGHPYRLSEPGFHAASPGRCSGTFLHLRLRAHEHRYDSRQQTCRHHKVSNPPAFSAARIKSCCNRQSSGARPQHRKAVPRLIHRRKCGLLLLVTGLNTESIERNILCGAEKSRHKRTGNDGIKVPCRITERHGRKSGGKPDLRQQQPGASSAEAPGQQRDSQSVHKRSPDPFKTPAEPHPAHKTDRL